MKTAEKIKAMLLDGSGKAHTIDIDHIDQVNGLVWIQSDLSSVKSIFAKC